MPDGVTGNTFDSESKESRFDPWSGNKGYSKEWPFCIPGEEVYPDDTVGNPWSGNKGYSKEWPFCITGGEVYPEDNVGNPWSGNKKAA